jgi:hypothetical protein
MTGAYYYAPLSSLYEPQRRVETLSDQPGVTAIPATKP